MACFCGRPSCISILMLLLMVVFDLPDFNGITSPVDQGERRRGLVPSRTSTSPLGYAPERVFALVRSLTGCAGRSGIGRGGGAGRVCRPTLTGCLAIRTWSLGTG
jgi:hypothetical protein